MLDEVATGFDVVLGDVDTLRSSGGDFSQATATEECLENNLTATDLAYSPGDGLWFLVRGVNCAEGINGSHGTYDSAGSGQVGLRDAEIAASGNDCP